MINLTDSQKAIEEMYEENKRLREENEKLKDCLKGMLVLDCGFDINEAGKNILIATLNKVDSKARKALSEVGE